jgi:hypothetical protein
VFKYLAAQAKSTRPFNSFHLPLCHAFLAARVGFPETEHAVHLLQKVPIPWITPEFLAQLRTVMTEEPNVVLPAPGSSASRKRIRGNLTK